jgi:UDP-N-acetylmuramoylalanine--D-glutamate ligase
MIRASTFAGKRVAVFGLGASGNATVLSLLEGGAEVCAWDDSAASRAASASAGLPVVDLAAADWSTFSSLVLAPGVPLTHPEPHWTVRKAQAAGVEVIGDVEIFFRERAATCPKAPVVCITGTNGKSTTTALTAHILHRLGHDVAMGGNIGVPLLSLDPPSRTRIHVLELSSFQIDLTPSLKPTVGVLLNLTPDHIDRHGTFEHYAAVKERLVQSAEAACLGADDVATRDIAERIEPASRLYVFTAGKGSGVVPRLYAIGSTLFVHERTPSLATSEEIASLASSTTLRGMHNVQNALAALAALRALEDRLQALGSDLEVWRKGELAPALLGYPGLAHRMEEIGRSGRVLFINDSKATNADSTEKALASWDRDIFLIAGGKPKEGGIAGLEPYFPRLAKVYLIGQASDDFAATLQERVPFERCGTLDVAVAAAARDAGACPGTEPVVLLSPACASYDQFRNFEQRGEAFRALVAALPGVTLSAAMR